MSKKISQLYVYTSEDPQVLPGDVQIVLPSALEVVPHAVILEDEVGQHRFAINPEASEKARSLALKRELAQQQDMELAYFHAKL